MPEIRQSAKHKFRRCLRLIGKPQPLLSAVLVHNVAKIAVIYLAVRCS